MKVIMNSNEEWILSDIFPYQLAIIIVLILSLECYHIKLITGYQYNDIIHYQFKIVTI